MVRLAGDGPTELTWDQDIELLVGPRDDEFDPERSHFDSEEERRQAWLLHRERITEWCLQGRPWAAEHYDAE